MIIKITNKSKNFYTHLGKVFASREVERLTKDRIFDDDNKEWYLYYNKGIPDSFVSVSNGIIKNVWTYDKPHLIQILIKLNSDLDIKDSVVTNYFLDEYIESGFEFVNKKSDNFSIIRGNHNGATK